MEHNEPRQGKKPGTPGSYAAPSARMHSAVRTGSVRIGPGRNDRQKVTPPGKRAQTGQSARTGSGPARQTDARPGRKVRR